MAQRFKASDLKEMIRSLVREEIRGVVKDTINEVLSERYLRQIAETGMARGVANIPTQDSHRAGDDESQFEETPEILGNDIPVSGDPEQQTYNNHRPNNNRVKQFGEDKRNEMLNMFFEGTKPLRERESSVTQVGALPEQMVEQAEIWKKMVQGMDRAAESKRPMANPASEEARIKRLREELDRKMA